LLVALLPQPVNSETSSLSPSVLVGAFSCFAGEAGKKMLTINELEFDANSNRTQIHIQNYETTKEPKPNPSFKGFCTLTPVERCAGEPAIFQLK